MLNFFPFKIRNTFDFFFFFLMLSMKPVVGFVFKSSAGNVLNQLLTYVGVLISTLSLDCSCHHHHQQQQQFRGPAAGQHLLTESSQPRYLNSLTALLRGLVVCQCAQRKRECREEEEEKVVLFTGSSVNQKTAERTESRHRVRGGGAV